MITLKKQIVVSISIIIIATILLVIFVGLLPNSALANEQQHKDGRGSAIIVYNPPLKIGTEIRFKYANAFERRVIADNENEAIDDWSTDNIRLYGQTPKLTKCFDRNPPEKEIGTYSTFKIKCKDGLAYLNIIININGAWLVEIQ